MTAFTVLILRTNKLVTDFFSVNRYEVSGFPSRYIVVVLLHISPKLASFVPI